MAIVTSWSSRWLLSEHSTHLDKREIELHSQTFQLKLHMICSSTPSASWCKQNRVCTSWIPYLGLINEQVE